MKGVIKLSYRYDELDRQKPGKSKLHDETLNPNCSRRREDLDKQQAQEVVSRILETSQKAIMDCSRRREDLDRQKPGENQMTLCHLKNSSLSDLGIGTYQRFDS